jgi:hypothetical protein
MYQAMDSDFFSSSLYWLVGVIVVNFWLINLVVAVVVNTFKDIRADTKKSAFGADEYVTSSHVRPICCANDCSSLIGADAQWAIGEKKHKSNMILKVYEKTKWFWILLVLADLVSQACKTAGSSDSMIDLLSRSHGYLVPQSLG